MNLAEYQKKYGIKRIDFSKVERTELDEQYGTDRAICPYCELEFEYEAEDIDDILGGMVMQCPQCEKNFYIEGELTVDTTCKPMEDAVLDNRRYIEAEYDHGDKCEAKGMEWPEKQIGMVEWETYAKWARPLFENMEKDEEGE